MSNYVTKDSKIAFHRNVIDAFHKYVAEDQTIVLGGKTLGRDEAIAMIEEGIALAQASKVARLEWIEAARRERAHMRAKKEIHDLLLLWIRVTFGELTAADFGLEPKKQRRKLTGEERLAMAEKMRATRAARQPKTA